MHEYEVTVPDDADPKTWELAGSVGYRHRGSVASLAVSAAIEVVPAVVVESATARPEAVGPGKQATLRAVVRNRGERSSSGTMTFEVPSRWTAPEPVPFRAPASGTAQVETTVDVPLEVTEGEAAVTVSIGATTAERSSATVAVAFDNPPTDAVDHVDLGEASSEEAHALRASPSSGTSVEAGLTRRYTNSAEPGGWFELDVEVPTDGRFAIRSVETYDSPQLKTYDVVVDGEVVHERRYQRTAGGEGSLSYQFLVDDPAASADGVVTLRFQDVGADYDPSIADVWVVPLG